MTYQNFELVIQIAILPTWPTPVHKFSENVRPITIYDDTTQRNVILLQKLEEPNLLWSKLKLLIRKVSRNN